MKRLRNRLLTATARALSLLLGAVPWRAAQRCGAALGWIGWRVARRDRRRTLDHLQIAFPELSSAERHRRGAECFRHLGVTLAESLHLARRSCEDVRRHVRVAGWESVEAARHSQRPVIIVTGHCGNWELLAATVNCRGLGMRVIARELDETRFQDLLVSLRRRFGTETIARGRRGAARRLLRVLRERHALGILIDQDTDVEGVWVPFFDRPAYTPNAAAKLAGRHDAALIPAFIERRLDGTHLARFLPEYAPAGGVEADTAALTALIEEQIRRRPEQWVWLHRRWRRRPDGGGG